MAKKVARKARKVVRAKKEVKRAVKKSKAPFVLNIIAIIILLLNSAIVLLGKKWVVRMLTQYGLEALAANLLTYGVIWLILGILIWISTVRVEKSGSRVEKWYLFALSIITLFSGRLESGILTLIGSIMYLNRK